MTHVADITGKLIVDKNILFEHLAKNITHDDELNRRNSSTWGQGEKVYLSRLKNNFELKKEEIIQDISDLSHKHWLESKYSIGN